jgi:hypothetical protein
MKGKSVIEAYPRLTLDGIEMLNSHLLFIINFPQFDTDCSQYLGGFI